MAKVCPEGLILNASDSWIKNEEKSIWSLQGKGMCLIDIIMNDSNKLKVLCFFV